MQRKQTPLFLIKETFILDSMNTNRVDKYITSTYMEDVSTDSYKCDVDPLNRKAMRISIKMMSLKFKSKKQGSKVGLNVKKANEQLEVSRKKENKQRQKQRRLERRIEEESNKVNT